DPPARQVRQRRPEVGPAELHLEPAVGLLAELDPGVVGTDTEGKAQEDPRARADADREADGGHGRSVAEARRERGRSGQSTRAAGSATVSGAWPWSRPPWVSQKRSASEGPIS